MPKHWCTRNSNSIGCHVAGGRGSVHVIHLFFLFVVFDFAGVPLAATPIYVQAPAHRRAVLVVDFPRLQAELREGGAPDVLWSRDQTPALQVGEKTMGIEKTI